METCGLDVYFQRLTSKRDDFCLIFVVLKKTDVCLLIFTLIIDVFSLFLWLRSLEVCVVASTVYTITFCWALLFGHFCIRSATSSAWFERRDREPVKSAVHLHKSDFVCTEFGSPNPFGISKLNVLWLSSLRIRIADILDGTRILKLIYWKNTLKHYHYYL